SCGYDTPKWIGKCPACGEWNTFVEVKFGTKKTVSTEPSFSMASASSPISMSKIPTAAEPRINLRDNELNRVLGGGLVPGSLTLLGGEPGIGKSTLVLQTVLHLHGMKILYVSGEESARQLKLRADRILEGKVLAADTAFFVPSFTSTNVFHSPQAGHLPIHFGVSYPHEEQTYAVFSFAIVLLSKKRISQMDKRIVFT
ncbi:MAG: AAA family ATPase, partial [Bacteroidaceae bacterium]|nr:AAA family ATPase [Bacteroidaceae bacterium]